MAVDKYFLHQIKQTSGVITKGIVVKDTFDAAKQGYHAYFGAYAYGQDAATDYVQCFVTDAYGNILTPETTWIKPEPQE
jgi:hypothetical protein